MFMFIEVKFLYPWPLISSALSYSFLCLSLISHDFSPGIFFVLTSLVKMSLLIFFIFGLTLYSYLSSCTIPGPLWPDLIFSSQPWFLYSYISISIIAVFSFLCWIVLSVRTPILFSWRRPLQSIIYVWQSYLCLSTSTYALCIMSFLLQKNIIFIPFVCKNM